MTKRKIRPGIILGIGTEFGGGKGAFSDCVPI